MCGNRSNDVPSDVNNFSKPDPDKSVKILSYLRHGRKGQERRKLNLFINQPQIYSGLLIC